MAIVAKFVLPIPIFFAYLVPLDVDVTGNITSKICEVWSELNIFYTLVTMATATINEIRQKHRNRLDKLCRSYNENKKGGKFFWIPFIKLHETL
jgi:hypothetical protein